MAITLEHADAEGRIKLSAGRKKHVLYDIKYVFKADEVDGRL